MTRKKKHDDYVSMLHYVMAAYFSTDQFPIGPNLLPIGAVMKRTNIGNNHKGCKHDGTWAFLSYSSHQLHLGLLHIVLCP